MTYLNEIAAQAEQILIISWRTYVDDSEPSFSEKTLFAVIMSFWVLSMAAMACFITGTLIMEELARSRGRRSAARGQASPISRTTRPQEVAVKETIAPPAEMAAQQVPPRAARHKLGAG